MNKLFVLSIITIVIIILYYFYFVSPPPPSPDSSGGSSSTIQAVSPQPPFKDGVYVIRNEYKYTIADNHCYLNTLITPTPPPDISNKSLVLYGNKYPNDTGLTVFWYIGNNSLGTYVISNKYKFDNKYTNSCLSANDQDLTDSSAFLWTNTPKGSSWNIILNTDGSYCIQNPYHRDGAGCFLSTNGDMSGYNIDENLTLQGTKYSDAGEGIYWTLTKI